MSENSIITRKYLEVFYPNFPKEVNNKKCKKLLKKVRILIRNINDNYLDKNKNTILRTQLRNLVRQFFEI